ncbi:MAG: hypothetical protein U0736_10355 [Gemmataceae bacterium]
MTPSRRSPGPVRGDDLVPSTPRQLLLYDRLQLPPPRFVHVPLVVGPDDPAASQAARRHPPGGGVEAEVSPALLRDLLDWSCGWLEKVLVRIRRASCRTAFLWIDPPTRLC